MRNGTIIQIKGLGVPVQSSTDRNQDGYEIRWSSDPEVAEDAPAHVLLGHQELTRFMEVAVHKQFMLADLMTITPVKVADDSNSLARNDAVAAGINPENWSTVRVGLAIGGNAAKGPIMDTIEWVGTRDEYAEGEHLREAFEHAVNRGIRNPIIQTHTERGHIMRAAHFFAEFNRQMKPSLRAADMMARAIETSLCSLDLRTVGPDRAHHFLTEIQRAFITKQEYAAVELQALGIVDPAMAAAVQHNVEDSQPSTKYSSGPRFN